MYLKGCMYPRGYMYPWGYMYPHGLSCTLMHPHHNALQCITVHPSASHLMRLHQTLSDSHPPKELSKLAIVPHVSLGMDLSP